MSPTVLYVEDNEDNIVLVERLLRRRPHLGLLIARDGADGLRQAVDATPALVLLDRRLPDMPGEEVLSHLKATATTTAIPVVMVSGDAPEDGALFLAAGATDVLAKPFDISLLLAAIDRFCPAGG